MATFTIEVREIVDELGVDIFTKPHYPIFDESYRQELNQKIIDFYWYTEIGFETVDQFVNRLNIRMRTIMPYFNKLYESELLKYDPLISYKTYTEGESETTNTNTSSQTATGESNTSTTSDTSSRSVSSEFPQTMLEGDGDYATNAADSVSGATSGSTGSEMSSVGVDAESAGEGKTKSVSEGHMTPVAQLVLLYRETLLNIDEQIIMQLGDLFMGLWNIGDEYGRYGQPYLI